MESGVEDVERIKSELASREEAAGTFEAKKAELAARVKPSTEELAAETEEPEGDDGDDDDSPAEVTELAAEVEETEEVVEELVAAVPARVRRPLPKPSGSHRAVQEEPKGFVAASGLPGFQAGQRGRLQDGHRPCDGRSVILGDLDTTRVPAERRMRLA